MSHVDEGELTAYADGAYPAGDSDAQRIEEHLALCANCRNRLDQARALSGRAAAILATAAPLAVAMPEFAEIRSAAVVARRRKLAIPLSWAATVVLALGIGWFGRSAVMTPRAQRTAVNSEPAEQNADAVSAVAEPPSSPAVAPATQGTGAAARRADTPPPLAKQEMAAAANKVADAAPLTAAAPPPSGNEDARSLETRAVVGQAAGAAAADVDYITAAEAERRGIELHRVPELEVLRVGLRQNEVRVEQKLPDGRVLTINATPEQEADFASKRAAAVSAAPARERAELLRDAAENSVVVNRGAVRLRISGAMPEDSLRIFAARIR